jgi:mono/diheme cytochrome c family protein
MIWQRTVCAVAFAIAATSAWACGDDSTGDDNAASCPKDNPECKEIATVQAGSQAVVKRRCVECHGQDMSGSVTMLPGIPNTIQGDPVELYPPNLTSDETGVGQWTDDALALAIRSGIDDESQALCPQMKHFSQMSDFEAYSIVKYLRDIPKVKKQVPRSVCPPTKTKEQQSLPR